MGRYVEVYVDDDDTDVDAVLSDYTHGDWVDFVGAYRSRIDAVLADNADITALLSDPVKRLEIIVALRAEGYVVESA